jgi:hypothetical protein
MGRPGTDLIGKSGCLTRPTAKNTPRNASKARQKPVRYAGVIDQRDFHSQSIWATQCFHPDRRQYRWQSPPGLPGWCWAHGRSQRQSVGREPGFGSQTINTTSSPMSITLSNCGTVVTPRAIAISGEAHDHLACLSRRPKWRLGLMVSLRPT